MENKNNMDSVPMELYDDMLDNVHGGISEIPTVNYPGVLMTKHPLSTDAPAEDTTKSDLLASGFLGVDV